MKIFAVAIPLMIASSTIEKVSAGKPDDKGASGATGFIAKGTTTIEGCEKFHINLIVNFLPGDENVQGNFLFNCVGDDVCKVNINCIVKKDLLGADTVIASGTVINDCPTVEKGDVVFAAFSEILVDGGDDTKIEFAFGTIDQAGGDCNDVVDPDNLPWVDLIEPIRYGKMNPFFEI